MATPMRPFVLKESVFRFAQKESHNYSKTAGWSSLVARQAHNLKAAGSNPAPATKFLLISGAPSRLRYSKSAGKNSTSAYPMMSAAESISTISANRDGLAGRDLGN